MICMNEACRVNEGNECTVPEFVKIGIVGECVVYPKQVAGWHEDAA